MSHMTPGEIVHELDKFIVGQQSPNVPLPLHCVTAGAGSRWQIRYDRKSPKNILMIGPDRRREDRNCPPTS